MPTLSKNSRAKRNRVKRAIIRKNIELFDEAFAVEKYKVTHISENGAKIVKLWREKIGYAQSTWDGDILWNAYRNWGIIKRKKNGNKKIS